jgi:hypothetical protein
MEKIKMGLDETRMLILGAQILLGFQLREVFGDAFDELPPLSRHAEVAGLALMTVTVSLLIAPGPYHRLVYGGRDDPRLQPVITAFAEAALMPFALALGIDLYIAPGACVRNGDRARCRRRGRVPRPRRLVRPALYGAAMGSVTGDKCRLDRGRRRRLRSGSNKC